jgi:hypothetical protein
MANQLHRSPRPVARPTTGADRAPADSMLAVSNADQQAALHAQGATDSDSLLDAIDRTPTFAGFEDDRFQMHDARIEALVDELNADPAAFLGANPDQVASMGPLDPALVKSWMIQETGGDADAWSVDPAQVNNPGDWGDFKTSLGLEKPSRRNTGDADTNLRAAIALLGRKGFSRSGKAPSELQGGQEWSDWHQALTDYNGNNKRVNGQRHKDAYAERIEARAANPAVQHRIPLNRAP